MRATLALVALVTGGLFATRLGWRGTGTAPLVKEAPSAAQLAPAKDVTVSTSASADPHDRPSAAAPAATAAPLADVSVIRPKKRAREKVNTQVRSIATKVEEAPSRLPTSISAGFLDRPSVASESETLPRGTLIRAKLVHPIDPLSPGVVQAVVTEDVAKEGVVVVPTGSAIGCSSRASKDDRVGLSCESIKTTDRMLLFSGLAVGEGHHVGLRVLDGEVPTGTAFVVYVSASAVLR